MVPLSLRGELIGTMWIISAQSDAFREDDLLLLEAYAATITAAIQNARLHNTVQSLAVTDLLTGLLNRRGFNELGNREIARYRRYGRLLSMIMVDIDDFKGVNDTFGHAFGDIVLKALTESCTTFWYRLPFQNCQLWLQGKCLTVLPSYGILLLSFRIIKTFYMPFVDSNRFPTDTLTYLTKEAMYGQ